MAIDSALKRKSISGILLLIPGVTPDATTPAAWRQSAAWSYAGIATAAPAVTVVPYTAIHENTWRPITENHWRPVNENVWREVNE